MVLTGKVSVIHGGHS